MSATLATIPAVHRAAHFVGGGQIAWRERAVPRPGPGELLLRVTANAVCGTDRGLLSAGSSVTPGHEVAGVVAAAGEGSITAVGSKGVVYLMDFCGSCRECRAGATNICSAKRADVGFTHDGGYGRYAAIHETSFFLVDDAISAAEATLLLDVMGTASHALDRALAVRTDIACLAVAGAGPVGLGIVAMARLLLDPSLPVLVADFLPYRLALAERLGATPVDLRGQTLTQALAAYGLPGTADVAVDTTGRSEARRMLLDAVGRGGVLVCVGHGGSLQLDVSADLIAQERSVLGSEYFPYRLLERNHQLLLAHRAYLAQIVTHRFPIDRIADAYSAFLGGKTGKVLVEQ